MANEDLIIRIGAKADQFTDELKRIEGKTKSLQSGLKSLAKVSGAAFLGLTGAIGLTVKQFADFDNGIRGVKTLLNEASFGSKGLQKGFEELRSEALKLAADAPIAIKSLNKALFDTVSAGIDAGKAVDVVRIASELAVAGLTDVSIATDGITSALNAYGLEAEDAEAVASKFFLAQVAGKTTIAELSSFFGRAGATAANYGVSLDELLSSVSAVTAGGVKTQAAFTGLNALLVNISKPTEEAAKEAKRLGIEFNSTALRAQGLEGFLNTLKNSNGFTQLSIEKLFGSVEAQKIAFGLTGAQAELFADTIEKLGDKTKAAQTFQEAYAIQSASLTNKIKLLKNGISVLAITIGAKLAPEIGNITDLLSNATKNLNAMDDEQKESVATFLKWALVITGGVAAVTVFSLVAIKVSAIIGALTIAFGSAGLAASGFWISLTGPIGIAVIGLAAVAAGAVALFQIFKDPEPKKSLQEINTELDKLKKKESELESSAVTNRLGQKNRSAQRLDDIRDEIKELEKLEDAARSDRVQSGTGSLILRPKADRGFDSDVQKDLFGIDPIEIPLRPVLEESEKASTIEKVKTKVVDEETKKRIQAQREELEVNKAIAEEAEAIEVEFITRRQDLRAERIETDQIQNQEERELALENLRLKNEELDAEEEKHFTQKAELEAERMEQERIVQEELATLSAEERAALTEKDLEELRASAQTKDQIHRESIQRQLKEQRKVNKQFLIDQKKFGTAFATINKIMHSAIFQGSKTAFGELAALQQSSNSKLKAIGRIAAIANIVIRTAESAMNIFNGFSTIPVVGVALGVIGAAAAVAFGAEQIGKVKGAKHGALVGSGSRGVDTELFALGRGELIAPDRSFDEVVEGTARQRGFVKTGENGGGDLGARFDALAEAILGMEMIVIQGDVLADEAVIDVLAERLRDGVRFRNLELN